MSAWFFWVAALSVASSAGAAELVVPKAKRMQASSFGGAGPGLAAGLAPPAGLLALPSVPTASVAALIRAAQALPRTVESNMILPKDHPAVKRYLEMIEEINATGGRPSFAVAQLRAVQRDLAKASGLIVEDVEGTLAVAPLGSHWMNRWAASVRRTMGVQVRWNPLDRYSVFGGASYEPQGRAIMSDSLAPVLRKPSSALFHEFMHAYSYRGRHSEKMASLRTEFHCWGGSEFPKAQNHPWSSYSRDRSFVADEIMTTLHTVFDSARKILEAFGPEREGWTSSAPQAAPTEIRNLLAFLHEPIFLSESVLKMSTRLLPGIAMIARGGLKGNRLEKMYGSLYGGIPTEEEWRSIRDKDLGYFEAWVEEGTAPTQVRFLSRGNLAGKNWFPVFFGNGAYAAAEILPLPASERHALPGSAALIVTAARALAPKLAQLQRLNGNLQPSISTLRSLQERASSHVDLQLVREIRDASREAFLKVVHFFIRQP